MKKTVFISIFVVIIALALVLAGCSITPVNQDTPSAPLALLELFQKESGIAFSSPNNVSFLWNVEVDGVVDDIEVKGKSFNTEDSENGLFLEDYEYLKKFFEDRGFKIDPHNGMVGTASWLNGYTKGDMICALSGNYWLDDDYEPLETGEMDVGVMCGAPAEQAQQEA